MHSGLQFFVIDAFAHSAYSGNPAGVVLRADRLDDAQRVAIAREINAAETAFLTGVDDLSTPPGLRWFTPSREVEFCGHATLAAAHAMREVGLLRSADRGAPRLDAPASPYGPPTIEFQTRFVGRLGLRFEPIPTARERSQPGSGVAAWGADEDGLWWLGAPEAGLEPDNTNPMKTLELLGLRMEDLDPAVPIMRTRDRDLILAVRRFQSLAEMRPNFHGLRDWSERHNLRGFFVTTRDTLTRGTDTHSRFFAPAFAVDEDPVTGSAHGALAALLAQRGLVSFSGETAALHCVQGEPGGRTGLVRALIQRDAGRLRVLIGGRCITTMSGEIRVPGG